MINQSQVDALNNKFFHPDHLPIGAYCDTKGNFVVGQFDNGALGEPYDGTPRLALFVWKEEEIGYYENAYKIDSSCYDKQYDIDEGVFGYIYGRCCADLMHHINAEDISLIPGKRPPTE